MSSTTPQISTTAYVCVHGIGVHDSGDLAEQTRDAVRRGAEAAGGSLTDLPVDSAAPAELTHRARVEVPGHEPYLAEFHDGWWDSGLRTPRFWVVLLWLLEIAPFALISGAGGWCGDRWREAEDGVGAVGRAGRRLAALLTSAAMLAAVPLVVLVLLIGLPLAGLVPPWRRGLHHVLVEVVGDVWLYRSAALDDTVLPRLRRLVEAAAARADRVTLVGHSQGAELSRRVALRTAPERCVWVGSGEHQLSTLRVVAASAWLPLVVWPFVLAWPAFLHLALTRGLDAVAEAGRGPGVSVHGAGGVLLSGAAVVVLAAVLYGALTAAVVRWLRRRPDDVGQVPQSRIWHVKSLLDPISWGTVFPTRIQAEDREQCSPDSGLGEGDDGDTRRGQVCVRYVPPHPEGPWWAEHVTYFSRPATGAVILEAGLARPEPVLPGTVARVPPWLVTAAPVAGAGLLWMTHLLGEWQIQLLR
ncbi:hypothetical protein [Nesterenkonia xinjiangensis]|uniref:hypothetical protein n=1 Tax=Nesterenkonia xinjiangensis TaxID=225327 RepID=UPI0031D1129A